MQESYLEKTKKIQKLYQDHKCTHLLDHKHLKQLHLFLKSDPNFIIQN